MIQVEQVLKAESVQEPGINKQYVLIYQILSLWYNLRWFYGFH